MSQDFKFKYDDLEENNPTMSTENENYPAAGSVRNICFVQLDGRQISLNYAYLVSTEYRPDENKIILYFTSHTITLEGSNLLLLSVDLDLQLPKRIVSMPDRYNELVELRKYTINKIVVEKT